MASCAARHKHDSSSAATHGVTAPRPRGGQQRHSCNMAGGQPVMPRDQGDRGDQGSPARAQPSARTRATERPPAARGSSSPASSAASNVCTWILTWKNVRQRSTEITQRIHTHTQTQRCRDPAALAPTTTAFPFLLVFGVEDRGRGLQQFARTPSCVFCQRP